MAYSSVRCKIRYALYRGGQKKVFSNYLTFSFVRGGELGKIEQFTQFHIISNNGKGVCSQSFGFTFKILVLEDKLTW